MDENEFERQLDRLANGLGAIWVLHGEKVSDQLDQSLNETISYNLDREIWLEIISRLNHHPDLSEYVSQRVLSGAKPQTYSNEELGPHASTSEQLRWAWKELKGTTKSVQAICNGANLNSGIATVLRVAKIEEELMHTAIGLMVDYTCAPGDTVMHERALADSYNGLEKANKWSLLPLFFNEQMTKRESRFLIDGEANDAYFEIFQRRLKADGLSINAVKKQFLESGIGELMPCLHQCDPSAWRIGEGINSSQLNRSSISTKREPSFSDENLDQLFKEDLHHENEKLENDKDFPMDRYQKNSSDDINEQPSGFKVFVDQIKNGIFYGVGLQIASLIFMFSDGAGVFFILGWIFAGVITIVVGLSWPMTLISTVMLIPTIPLYFASDSDKGDRFLFDLASVIGLIINSLVLLASYQLISEYGAVGLPAFEPYGIKFFYNFSY